MADNLSEHQDLNATNNVPTDSRSPYLNAELLPCGHKKNGRNLIVCVDGTSNKFGEKNTNVIELYNLLLKEVEDNQRTWYNSGIGTYARKSESRPPFHQVVYHKIESVIAVNFERTVLGAYRWLSDNYKRGDCIFLFGFSRGAFQVRVLSAMIDKVGLIYKGNEMQIPFAYELYRDPTSDEKSDSLTQVGSPESPQNNSGATRKLISRAERFKKTFSYKGVKVHFVGAWDTVSSIGGVNTLPRTVDGMKHVCYFRHALALDERRVKFLPEYAYGGLAKPNARNTYPGNLSTASSTNDDVSDDCDFNSNSAHPQTLEVWFAGTHSDIGGGNVKNVDLNRTRPSLRWMVFEAGALGLRTALFERELSPDTRIEINESLKGYWSLLELFPIKRLTYTRRKNGNPTSCKPHLGASRKIHAGQKIHASILLGGQLGNIYIPKARPLHDDPTFWDNLRAYMPGEWLERDLYTNIQDLVNEFTEGLDSNVLQVLQQTAIWSDGTQAVCKKLCEAVSDKLQDRKIEVEFKYKLLDSTTGILCKADRKYKQEHSVEIYGSLSSLSNSLESIDNERGKNIVRQFLAQCTSGCLLILSIPGLCLSEVAFSPDGKHIVSGSKDYTMQIWDVETGKQVGEVFRGHTDYVRSVGFSPDGKGVVSGSLDRTIRIWDAHTAKQVGKTLRGHTDYIQSVRFSPDSKHIVSGSDDGTIRIWDAETGDQVGDPFRGHTDDVNSVGFSHDGTRVVSGSSDRTIRIWDTETGEQVGDPFGGHADDVNSVGFSHDGRRVVSGSDDRTIRIWDADTGEQVIDPFQQHKGFVWSVAFSPDSTRIVSGSSDRTIRIWDAETGKQVGQPFLGHTDWVRSVGFSPDGKRVVSGSDDGTVRIWDVETRETMAQSDRKLKEAISM